ncbi:UNVERIFIED_CONTAM: hypothetical protein Sangu_1920800 [Sesamum angustifolium]|uniref:KIB1-4 beta-propeller domain-containing protein n=1 Tax=Sesamum angustifolium TaxID=2727405 RepID=A0AAW2LV20_9LAMI
MAPNKDKSLSTRKEAIGKRPWPNLPQQLLNLLARNPNLLQQMSYPGTTKSWTAPTSRCDSSRQARLSQLHDLEGQKWCSLSKTLPHFINIYFRTQVYNWWYYDCDIPCNFWHRPAPHFVGYSHGSLIHRWPNSSRIEVYDVLTRCQSYTPPWDVPTPFKFVALSSSSDYGHFTVVVLTGISSPALMVYSWGQEKNAWIKHECTTLDPYDAKKRSMQFTNIIGFQGKFYALSLQGSLAVMEVISSRLVVTTTGTNRAVPSVAARYFKEYLLESNGEILLVFLIYQKTLNVVDNVEVFRLHFPKLSWIKVERLQERALFLENECCIWINSSQTGCRGNCVYFTRSAADEWFLYDMESGCISPGLAASSLPWSEPVMEE